ncbi:MAG: prenyltransferase/squalene oxidase repeat-containing protein [Planctomycetota bacterium]
MSDATYLQILTLRLADGIARLPEATRDRASAYFRNSQREDGGFAGREGGSDPYYTGFGLRSLALSGTLDDAAAQAAADFLGRRLRGHESIVDFYSLLYSAQILKLFADVDVYANVEGDWQRAVFDLLCSLRRDDGGFAKGQEGHASSTYHTFLVMLCFELIDQALPQPEEARRFLCSQFVEDGGFREIRASKRAGTNPTAAAIAGLRMLGGLDDELAEPTVDFLLEMQTDEGGFRANTRIPIADLLSSFTALVTLADLGALHEVDLPAVERFVMSLWQENGGFIGASWDEVTDVEYSFYGLGCLGMLRTAQA